MRSSYHSSVEFGEVLRAIVATKTPVRKIAEYGILDGFSLDIFDRESPVDCTVEARDVFEEFVGNRPNETMLLASFADRRPKTKVLYGDFYKAAVDLEDGAYDIIHVDIANDGLVYRTALVSLLPKLADGGLLLLEGGTKERDEVPWMSAHKKEPMAPVAQEWKKIPGLTVHVFGTFPGLTMVSRAAEA